MLKELQSIVRDYAGNDTLVITGDTVLLTDLGLNSYELVELVCRVEEQFGIEVPDRAIGGLKTVQNLLDYIAAHT